MNPPSSRRLDKRMAATYHMRKLLRTRIRIIFSIWSVGTVPVEGKIFDRGGIDVVAVWVVNSFKYRLYLYRQALPALTPFHPPQRKEKAQADVWDPVS